LTSRRRRVLSGGFGRQNRRAGQVTEVGTSMRMVFEFSAGGAVVNGEREVLLVRTRTLNGGEVWTFPKGIVEKGEKSPEAALREVREETGYRCEIESELPASEYWFRVDGRLVKKKVRWFKMRPIRKEGDPDHEVEEAAWLSMEEAKELVTYPSDVRLLQNISRP
jgi:8-oxo-dGTP pyrophosphatase MutT (NUDIX family)